MKLERLHEYVTSTVVIGIGIGLAVAAGQSTGEGQVKLAGIIIAGIFLLGLCLRLKTNIWVLIPLCWELTGTIPITNLPFSIHDEAVALVFGSYLLLYALKILRSKPVFELLDGVILANLCYLGLVFVRNPVGLNWLESDRVGGKPYFDIIIAFLAYLVLSRVPVNLKLLARLPILMLVGSFFVSLAGMVASIAPGLGDRLGLLYSGFAPAQVLPGAVVAEDTIGRRPLLGNFGNTGIRVWCSYFIPTTLFLPIYPFRLIGTVVFLVAILLSGFRNLVFATAVYVVMSCYFRKRIQDLFILTILGAVLIVILAAGNNRIFTLPVAAQRALSFLPGDWDYEAKSDAEGSTEWRHQIWRMALMEDQWIQNKWLGDGFGFTSYQLSIMNSAQGFIGGAEGQEAYLVAGNYHSGPISAIRYAGVVGLVLFLPLLFLVVRRSLLIIKKASGTKLFPVALFIGMPTAYYPIYFIFIAGGYDSGLTDLIFATGLLKLIDRALDQIAADARLEAKDGGETMLHLQRPVLRQRENFHPVR